MIMNKLFALSSKILKKFASFCRETLTSPKKNTGKGPRGPANKQLQPKNMEYQNNNKPTQIKQRRK